MEDAVGQMAGGTSMGGGGDDPGLPARWRRMVRSALKPQALVASLSLLVAALTLTAFTVVAGAQRRAALGDAGERAADVATMLAEQAGRLLDAADLALGQVVAMPGDRPWDEVAASKDDFEALSRLVERLGFLGALWLTDEDGWSRLTSRAFPAPRIGTGDREYFQQARDLDRAGPFISTLLRSRYQDELNFVVARRLQDSAGRFRGIAQAVIEPGYLIDFYRSVGLGREAEIEVARADGAVILRYPEVPERAALGLRLPEGRQAEAHATGRPQPFPYVSTADGTARIGAMRWVSGFPVLVQVGLSEREVLAEWRRSVGVEAALTAAALAAVLGLGAAAARGAVREQEAAAELERRVAERTAALNDALAAKDVLLREVNHRVKNNLQLVSGLLGMQRARTRNAEARVQLDEAQARIRSIAGLHRHLYAGDGHDTVEMAEYLRALALELAESAGGTNRRIAVEADPLRVSADHAVPLGLIANELATNALKHAYAEGEDGEVTLRLRACPGSGAVRLEVADRGRGLPADFDPGGPGAGLGMRIVSALARQLRGTLHVAPAEPGPGTLFRVELPPLTSGAAAAAAAAGGGQDSTNATA